VATAEIRKRAERIMADRAAKLAQPPRKKSRSPSAATRRKLSAATRDYYAKRALADPDIPAVKKARLDRQWTLEKAAKHADLALNTVWSAEQGRPISKRTRRALSRAYAIPIDVLRD
jgi:hypothetical protein